jgi:hypothetical protein
MFRFTIRDMLWLTFVVALAGLLCIPLSQRVEAATIMLCDYVWNLAVNACMRLEGRQSVSLQ